MQAKNLVDEPKRNTNSNLVKGVTENDSILHQGEYIHNGTILYPKTIHEDFNWLLLSDPEISIVGDEFKKSENLADDVSDYYVEKYSGKITREGIGIVNLSRKSIQASISHGIGKNKRAAFVAVPEVIKYGKVFQIDPNHKDRGYSSTIISAPIKIWNKTFICEVAINKKIGEDESSFYLHNVEIKEKLLSGTRPVRTYIGEDQKRKNPSKASKLIISKVFEYVNKNHPTNQQLNQTESEA